MVVQYVSGMCKSVYCRITKPLAGKRENKYALHVLCGVLGVLQQYDPPKQCPSLGMVTVISDMHLGRGGIV